MVIVVIASCCENVSITFISILLKQHCGCNRHLDGSCFYCPDNSTNFIYSSTLTKLQTCIFCVVFFIIAFLLLNDYHLQNLCALTCLNSPFVPKKINCVILTNSILAELRITNPLCNYLFSALKPTFLHRKTKHTETHKSFPPPPIFLSLPGSQTSSGCLLGLYYGRNPSHLSIQLGCVVCAMATRWAARD